MADTSLKIKKNLVCLRLSVRCLVIRLFVFCPQAVAKGFVLIQTKEVLMRPEDVKRVFQNSEDDLVEWITKGGFCGLHGYFVIPLF